MQSVIVSNFSVFNCIGRMSTTFLLDKIFNCHVARTDFLVMGNVCSAVCSLLAARSTIDSLPLIAIVSGMHLPTTACGLFSYCTTRVETRITVFCPTSQDMAPLKQGSIPVVVI